MRIALVDDCPNDLSIMHQFLAEALDTDSVITEFHNGEDFLQHWSADTFDLIVLDIYMEQLTGIEIARVIRETDPNVCLVFATTSNEFASESYEVNACYYLCKPFLKQQVLAMLLKFHVPSFFRMGKKYFYAALFTQITPLTG